MLISEKIEINKNYHSIKSRKNLFDILKAQNRNFFVLI